MSSPINFSFLTNNGTNRTNGTLGTNEARDTEPVDEGGAPVDGETTTTTTGRRRPNLRVARDARRRATRQQGALQLMNRLQAQAEEGETPAPDNDNPLGRLLGTPVQDPVGDPPEGKGGEPGKGGAPGKGGQPVGKGGEPIPPQPPMGDAARNNAQLAIQNEPPQRDDHPFVQERNETRGRLDRLGLTNPSDDRIHIDDAPGHGQMVTNTAAGRTSLIDGAEVTLDLDGARPEAFDRVLTDEERARGEQLEEVSNRVNEGKGGVEDLATLGAGELEGMLVRRRAAINDIASEIPEDEERKTFVNMSWGQSPERVANNMTRRMLDAPEGSKLREETEAILGGPPKTEGTEEEMQAQFLKLKEEAVYPALDEALKSEEHQERMAEGRKALEQEVAAARDKNVLIFVAAGNEFDTATDADRPDLTQTSMAGVKGLIRVGATDINGVGAGDDEIADFSNGGPVDVAAPGVDIPVGQDGKGGPPNPNTVGPPAPAKDVDGTSFAAPIATEVAYAMAAANPKLSIDQIETLMKDPRAVRNLEGSRDGAGQLDEFAAVVLARNPKLSRQQIDTLRTALGDPDANIIALKRQYGLN